MVSLIVVLYSLFVFIVNFTASPSLLTLSSPPSSPNNASSLSLLASSSLNSHSSSLLSSSSVTSSISNSSPGVNIASSLSQSRSSSASTGAISTQPAIAGEPIRSPGPSPTGVNAPIGENSTNPGTIGPGGGISHVSGPQANAAYLAAGFLQPPGQGGALAPTKPIEELPGNNAPSSASEYNPLPDNSSPSNSVPANPNPPPSDPNTGSSPYPVQSVSESQNTNPSKMSSAQLSVVHQALSPSLNPAITIPAQQQATVFPNAQSGVVQLQPISSAIFGNPPASDNPPENPGNDNLGNAALVPAPGGGDTSNGGSGISGQGSNAHQVNNAPPPNNAPQANTPQYASPVSSALPGQGILAGVAQSVVTKAPNGGLVVGSSTILPGQVATVNNHQVSVGSSNVVVDSNTYAFAASAPAAARPITVAGLAMQSASNGGVVMASQTLAPGAQTTIGGHVISVGSGNVVVDGNTQFLPTAATAAAPEVMVGGSAIQRASNGAVIIGGSTLAVGTQTTIAGHVISVGAANVVVDGTTNALATPAPTAAPILINGQQMQRASNGGLVIGSTTLPPGTQTTISGQVISVGPNNVVVGSSTYNLPITAGATLLSPTPGAQRNAITLLNGAVLSAGGSLVTISGEVVSMLSNDQGAVIDGSTILFASTTAQSVYTVAGQTFAPSPTGFVVDGTTVSLHGNAVTIGGTVVSLGPSGLQIGSSTIPLSTVSTTGLGGYLISAFNFSTIAVDSTGSPTATSSVAGGSRPIATSIPGFTGTGTGTGSGNGSGGRASGAKSKRDVWLLSWSVVVCTGIGVLAIWL